MGKQADFAFKDKVLLFLKQIALKTAIKRQKNGGGPGGRTAKRVVLFLKRGRGVLKPCKEVINN